MDIKDRTLEFQQSVTTYSKRHAKQLNGLGGGQEREPQPLKKSEFQQRASQISHHIAEVAQLLGKLAQLAKRKPMFNDNPIEIAEMTYLIRRRIHNIEHEMTELSKHCSKNGSLESKGATQAIQHTKNVVNLLNTKMKNVSGDFKSVLEARQKLEIANKDRWERIGSDGTKGPGGSMQGDVGRNLTAAAATAVSYNSANPFMSSVIEEDSRSNASASDQLIFPSEQALLLEEQQNANQIYLHERSRAVETIESTIQEVGNLFQQLAHMVQEQGETIQRIDANVEDIDLNISGAQRELLKYLDRISSNRWMAVKIFAIIFIFFLIWVLIS
ncbi:HFL076Wp [Eremothecium sinecaudum]|uniref:HFL076Wp n=1 Tax=Eremothecium sinecaudum TaxID=45286 RepID=A0A120K2K1_9SACH|nr:HFL076Wp [Eremothecium sinecaudum]AMD21780.1 HFL076Wp [Eremothecium sinecaudum]